MRIHHLTMTGVGPYAGKERIDFDAVGASGRFLLTGPTGSGKTTIIDAIVFALYGEVADPADSSRERIRSTLAGPQDPTAVELVFSTSAGVYRVRRTPAYERAKRRGQGTTTQNATVRLWHLARVGGEPLDEPVTRVGEADAQIARVVGLSREQFTQTVVLPQGKFARFLRAESSQRQGLLRDVFGTGIYDAIQDCLIQASRARNRQVDQAATDLRAQVGVLVRHPRLADREAEGQDGQGPRRLDTELMAALEHPVPDLEALGRATARAREESGQALRCCQALALQAADALERAREDHERAREVHDRLERRRALVEEWRCLEEQADQDARDAERLRAAERAERVRPLVRAERAARARAEQAVAALAGIAAGRPEGAGPDGPEGTEPVRPERTEPDGSKGAGPRRPEEAPDGPEDSIRQAVSALVGPVHDRARRVLEDLAGAGDHAAALLPDRPPGPGPQQAAPASTPGTAPAGTPGTAPPSTPGTAPAGTPSTPGTAPASTPSTPGTAQLDALAHRCRREHGQLEGLMELEAALPERSRALDRRGQELADAERLISRRLTDLDQRTAQRADLSRRLEEARLGGQREGLEDRRTRAHERHRAALSVQELTHQQERCRQECARAAQAAQEAAQDVLDTRLRWISSTAGALAGELRSGEPCPVCGSREHPLPASGDAPGASRAQVEQAEVLQGQADRALTAARGQLESVTERLARARHDADGMDVAQAARARQEADAAVDAARQAAQEAEDLAARLKALDAATAQEHQAVDAARLDRQAALSRLEADREALERDVVRCEQGRGTWPSVAARGAALLAGALEAEAASREVAEAGSALEQDGSARAELAEALGREGFTDVGQAEAARLDHDARQALEEAVRQADAARRRVRAGLEAPDLEDLDGQDHLGPAALALEKAQAAAERAGEARARTEASHAQLDRACTEVEQAASAYQAAVGSSAALLEVTALARGDNPTGTPLATWVLQARFDEVLVFANERLAQMSSGRYELVRVDQEAGQRGRRQGLGLAVTDNLGVGRSRDPRTLSGGETFYVSLALALALADVVSAESGGVSLDTLFIDEGFGTLDPQTLQDVLAELGRLQEGGRTVGIVSHVAELRRQIPDRIEVRRGKTGSTVRTTATYDVP
ncbi:AAA family ATPase [Actinomyces sp. oral taxon 897]|uniref:AAA family ATPase n=1 Tax=Actinomyces sp. oral taxon 897 TaxID=2081702 RepID=UPI000D042509|nr:SMC family ATPase [Actinomyces sp. oral taxon 897]AVM61562.1 SMC family ATPase [Actinomyces sp. oral taxon 897]